MGGKPRLEIERLWFGEIDDEIAAIKKERERGMAAMATSMLELVELHLAGRYELGGGCGGTYLGGRCE